MPNHVLARVLGVVWGLAMGAVALGSAVAAARVGLVGALLPSCSSVSCYRRSRSSATGGCAASKRRCRPAARLDVVDAVPIFAPLSLAAKEQVAAKLSDATAEPGQAVMREGDAGDLFYIVRDGELTVTVGRAARGRSRGDFFGEIALLRDVPRTATVTAATSPALCAATRRLPRGGDGSRARARGGGRRRGRATAARGARRQL